MNEAYRNNLFVTEEDLPQRTISVTEAYNQIGK